jgi:RPA family protein
MNVENKRMTAEKCAIGTIGNGMFVKQDGFDPSYVLSKTGKKLSRVRTMATIVDKFVAQDSKYASVTLDDGTGTIRAKAFKPIILISNLEKGDIVDMISKIRMYNEEIYLMPETVFKLDNPNMITLRKAELCKQAEKDEKKRELIMDGKKMTSDFDELKSLMQKKHNISSEEVEAFLMTENMPKTREEKETEDSGEKEKIIELIKKLDSGTGCDYSLIIKESGLPENKIEAIINDLLEDGTCFEPRPGIIKLL